METINVKGFLINLNFEPQIGSLNRAFRLSGTETFMLNYVIHTFRYIGTDEYFKIKVDWQGNFVSLL